MRNFSFKSQPSVLRTLKEPPKKNKKFNLDRALFIAILCFLILLLIRYIFIKVIFIQVDGQISLEKLNVNFTNDVRIKSLISKEGDAVYPGDTLFSYVNNSFQENALIERQIKGQNQINKEYEDLIYEIQNLSLEIQKENKTASLFEEEYKKVSRMVLLDLSTKSALQEVQARIDKTELIIWQLEQQLVLKKNRLSNLKKQLNSDPSPINTTSMVHTSLSYYVAPISGLIGLINFSPNEVCYETQSVMTIHNTQKINIKAYFNQEALPEIVIGTNVKIDFPDGSSSEGYISNVSVATYELPSEFQKKYEPTQRSILATVEPKHKNDLELWKRFYKMNVKVTINRLI